jgi:hypothetical protein
VYFFVNFSRRFVSIVVIKQRCCINQKPFTLPVASQKVMTGLKVVRWRMRSARGGSDTVGQVGQEGDAQFPASLFQTGKGFATLAIKVAAGPARS